MPTAQLDNLDLLTIGDCSIDLFMKVPDQTTGMKNSDSKMCFFHGSKIMVESFQTCVSGNAINVAVGAKQLGLKVGVYSETGDDINADRIKRELDEHKVNTDLLIRNKDTETALHAVVVFCGERTIFSYHGKRSYKIQNWKKPKYIYYTSLGEGFEEFQKELVNYLKANRDIGLIFNPGTYQMAKGLMALKDVLEITDILIVNKEEAEILAGVKGGDCLSLHTELHNLGVKLDIITDSDKGASAYDGTNCYQQDAYFDDRPVVDKTGAGDAFSAGFIAAIIYGKQLQEALKWGVVNSGCQIKVVGSIEGMLTKEEMEKIV